MMFNKVIVIIVAIILGIWLEGCDCKVVQFIFGDSLSDVGNNRHLSRSLAQANLPWYGIDMGNGLPNGRFSNGRTVADIIGDSLGLPRPPPVLDTSLTEKDILINGLNYASGGGGILNETGTYFIEKLSLDKQIELFQGTQELIRSKIGKRAADKFFREAQYVLHGLGARQLMVFGLGPMGCIPLQRVLTTTGNCREKVNKLALSFNKASSELIDDLVKELPNSNYRFGDAYDVVSDLISNPLKYGLTRVYACGAAYLARFQNSDSPCCSFGRIRPALTCVPASTLCSDRSKYVFWDEYHPSDSANELIANELIKKFGLSSSGQNAAPSPAPAIAPSPQD
ncbi:hypothetical protein TSUD_192560 [Trifolium subterraneum]|uniref:GDSL esterase/lipase n=1 Tax=Trifolium subterraneum TaxID=3900 RepID=A0A2Z6PKZ9_TRISU|nr:hypothetical protein TSUD_192560 [Trifolium subterraneum]